MNPKKKEEKNQIYYIYGKLNYFAKNCYSTNIMKRE